MIYYMCIYISRLFHNECFIYLVPDYFERRNYMSFFEYLLRLTSWAMTPPVLYGPFHLIAAFGGSAIAILAAWRFSSINNCNTNNRDNRRSFDQIMLVSGVILLIGELYKQLMNFYIVNNHAYDWWIFPFQLCSLPLYLCPLLIL